MARFRKRSRRRRRRGYSIRKYHTSRGGGRL